MHHHTNLYSTCINDGYVQLMQCSCDVNDMQMHVSTMCFIQVYVQGTINYTVQLGTHNVVSKVKRGDKLASLQNTYTALLTSGGSRISERGGQSTPLGRSGGMLPQEIFNFRPSEVVSGAFWVENCFLRLL